MAREPAELLDYEITIDASRALLNMVKRRLQAANQSSGSQVPVRYHRNKKSNQIDGLSIDGTNLTPDAIESIIKSSLNGGGSFSLEQSAYEPPQSAEREEMPRLDPSKAGDWDSLTTKLGAALARNAQLSSEAGSLRAELKDTEEFLELEVSEATRFRKGIDAVAESMGVTPPKGNVFGTDESASQYVETLLRTAQAMQAKAQRMQPDPEAEFTDYLIGYLLGFSEPDVKRRRLTEVIESHGARQTRTCVGGAVVRTFGSLSEKLDDVLVDLGYKAEPDRAVAAARIRSYFAAEKKEEWTPSLWDDSKEVGIVDLALSYRISKNGVTFALRNANKKPAGKKPGNKHFYRWADIKSIFTEEKRGNLRAPQPAGVDQIRPLNDDEVWELAQEESEARAAAERQVGELRAQVAEFQSQIPAEGSAVHLTTEDHLVMAFLGISQPSMEDAVRNYNRIFPGGIEEEVRIALMPLNEHVFRELGETLATMEGMEGIYTNGDGLDVAKLVERLKGYDVDFDETEYARENKELYDDAKASDYLWRFKLPGTLTAEEQTDSETIENYEGAKTNHERNKRAAQGLLAMVTELEENHGRCMERTEGFRKESLPLKALLTAYAYTFVENPGEEQKHVLRFLLPVTDQNIKEELALSFTYYLSNSLQGRDAQVRAGEILGCKYVDLVYSEDIADRAQTLILNTNDAVEKSVLAKAGAEINIQYIGGVPQHGR